MGLIGGKDCVYVCAHLFHVQREPFVLVMFFFCGGRPKTGSNHRLNKHGPVSWVTLICHEIFHTSHTLHTHTHTRVHTGLYIHRDAITHTHTACHQKTQIQLLRLTNPSPAQTRPDMQDAKLEAETSSCFPHNPIWKDPELLPSLLFPDKHTCSSKSHAKLQPTHLFF